MEQVYDFLNFFLELSKQIYYFFPLLGPNFKCDSTWQ